MLKTTIRITDLSVWYRASHVRDSYTEVVVECLHKEILRKCDKFKKEGKCTNNVTLRRIRVTRFAVVKQYVLHIQNVCVCSLN
jgi:hypothetical protein